MTPEELITSGNLELYVTGSLTKGESNSIAAEVNNSEKIEREVEKIEDTLIKLSSNVSPSVPEKVWTAISARISKIRTLDTHQKTNWTGMMGWAAAIVSFLGIFWMLNKNNNLNDDFNRVNTQNVVLSEELENARKDVKDSEELLAVIRSKDYQAITLPGNQAVAPQAYAKVYYNKKDNTAYIDTKGLPKAPEGKVYQMWSLKVQPLTPSNMGLLATDTAILEDEGIYKFEGFADPEAFGITLEPAGGSESPTLSQLYTLGAVSP